MRPQIALSLMGGEAAREYTCAMGDGGVDSTPPHPLLLSLFIIILFLQYFRRHSLLCLSLVLSCCCVPSSFFVVFIKLSPKLHPQSHFFNVLAVSSACIFFFSLSFFLHFLFFTYQGDPLSVKVAKNDAGRRVPCVIYIYWPASPMIVRL